MRATQKTVMCDTQVSCPPQESSPYRCSAPGCGVHHCLNNDHRHHRRCTGDLTGALWNFSQHIAYNALIALTSPLLPLYPYKDEWQEFLQDHLGYHSTCVDAFSLSNRAVFKCHV